MIMGAVAAVLAIVVVAGEPAAGDAAAAATRPAEASTDAWPQWRGPSRDGRVGGSTWPQSLDGLSRRWHVTSLGPSYSGPVVTPTRVFTTETRDETTEVVRAFDRGTGAPVWETRWPGAVKVPFFAARNGSWIRSTPAWDGARLYVAGMRDVLVCLDGATGQTVWRADLPERLGTPVPSFGFVCSPLVTAEHVYAQAGGGLVKLDKRSGAMIWRTLEGSGGMDSAFSSPVIATLQERRQLLVQTRAELCGVDPESGSVLWRQPIKSFRGMNILTPQPHGNAVFTAPYGGRAQLLSVSRDDDALAVSQTWDLGMQGYMTSPVVVDDHAYLFTRSNRFACVRLEDGEDRWISGPTGDSYWSLVAQGDRILALSDTGRLRLIHATPDSYEVIDETSVSDDQTWAHVAVAGRDVVVRELSGLAVFSWEE